MKLFIAHDIGDVWAKALRDSLKKRGLDASSTESIAGSVEWRQQVTTKLIDSDAIILVIRKKPFWPWIMFEAGVAFAAKKRVIAVTSEPEQSLSPLPNNTETVVADDPNRAAALIVQGLTQGGGA